MWAAEPASKNGRKANEKARHGGQLEPVDDPCTQAWASRFVASFSSFSSSSDFLPHGEEDMQQMWNVCAVTLCAALCTTVPPSSLLLPIHDPIVASGEWWAGLCRATTRNAKGTTRKRLRKQKSPYPETTRTRFYDTQAGGALQLHLCSVKGECVQSQTRIEHN